MSSGTRTWLVVLALLITILAVIREISIRRHMGDLTDWPTPADSTNGAR